MYLKKYFKIPMTPLKAALIVSVLMISITVVLVIVL